MKNPFGPNGILKTFLVLIFIGCRCGLNAQDDGILWPTHADISPTDRAAIVTLAKMMSIERPQSVSLGAYLPSPCRFMRLQSPVTETGHLRTWLELEIRRQDWLRGCINPLVVQNSGELGGGLLEPRIFQHNEHGAIRDDAWHVDIRFDTDVPYEDAKLIVLAIRHGQLLNRLPDTIGSIKLNTELPKIDPSTIRSINVSGARTYDVSAGSDLLRVKIVDGKVELHRYGLVLA